MGAARTDQDQTTGVRPISSEGLPESASSHRQEWDSDPEAAAHPRHQRQGHHDRPGRVSDLHRPQPDGLEHVECLFDDHHRDGLTHPVSRPILDHRPSRRHPGGYHHPAFGSWRAPCALERDGHHQPYQPRIRCRSCVRDAKHHETAPVVFLPHSPGILEQRRGCRFVRITCATRQYAGHLTTGHDPSGDGPARHDATSHLATSHVAAGDHPRLRLDAVEAVLNALPPRAEHPSQASRTVRAMGGEAHFLVLADDPHAILGALADRLVQLERCWTRFSATSELSHLNQQAGQPTITSPTLFHAISLGVAGARATDGLFSPVVGHAVDAVGYNRTWLSLDLDRPSISAPEAVHPIAEVQLLPSSRVVHVPPGVQFDLGGLGKGLAADLLVDVAEELGARSVSINVGGDLAGARFDPESPLLTYQVASSMRPLAWTTFDRMGAIATSSTTLRRFSDGRHHIIDPRTGGSAATDVVTASVLAERAVWAEMIATAMVVGGAEVALDLAERLDVTCILELDSGQVVSHASAHHDIRDGESA